MTRARWAALAASVAIAAVALALTFFRPSDEDRVRTVLVELGKIVMVKDGDTLLSRTARLRSRMKEVVNDDVRVNVGELGIDVRGRHKLEEAAAQAGLVYQTADVDFAHLAIRIDPEGTVATVDAVALVTASRGGERKIDKRDVHFLLHKADGWKISTMDVSPRKDEAP